MSGPHRFDRGHCCDCRLIPRKLVDGVDSRQSLGTGTSGQGGWYGTSSPTYCAHSLCVQFLLAIVHALRIHEAPSTSHRITVASELAAASVLPSGLKATLDDPRLS